MYILYIFLANRVIIENKKGTKNELLQEKKICISDKRIKNVVVRFLSRWL